MEDYDWGSDHVGTLLRLRTAIQILAETKGSSADRLQRATYALVTLHPRTFPHRLHNRATRMLILRKQYVFHAGDASYFHSVKASDRKDFIEDLQAIYEACLIDLGRSWPQWDFMYPKDIERR